jgi:putative transposase
MFIFCFHSRLPRLWPKAMQLFKGGSSKWVHETFPAQRLFGWQEKYGAFSVSDSQLDGVMRYINNQPDHHQHRSFQEELLALLKKHRIEYDEKYLWA